MKLIQINLHNFFNNYKAQDSPSTEEQTTIHQQHETLSRTKRTTKEQEKPKKLIKESKKTILFIV